LVTSRTSSDFEVQGPVQYNLSAAYTFGKLGLISVDYGLADYSGIKLRDNDGNSSSFIYENQGASSYLKNVQTIRAGAELKLSDEFSLRAGYALVTSATKDDAIKLLRWNTTTTDPGYLLDDKTNYYSVGFGYRSSNGWFVDFAYQLKVYKQDYYAYGTTTDSSLSDYHASDRYAYATSNLLEPAKITTKNNNFILTLGCKF
jgi:long-subunit fatty acid transport protein